MRTFAAIARRARLPTPEQSARHHYRWAVKLAAQGRCAAAEASFRLAEQVAPHGALREERRQARAAVKRVCG